MRVVVVGAGLVGPTLARLLARRGHAPEVVLERGRPPEPGGVRNDPLWLPFQSYDAMRDAGMWAYVEREGEPLVRMRDGTPTGYGMFRAPLVAALSEGVPIAYGRTVTGLVRDGGRVTGVRATGPEGEEEHPADLVVGCDGARSPVRAMAGIPGEVIQVEDGWMGALGALDPERDFAMRFLSDGRQIGMYRAPGTTFIFWQIGHRAGREAALTPGVEPFRQAVRRLLPEAETVLAGLHDPSRMVYWEALEVRGCDPWWVPGAVVIGDAAHAMTPETGVGSGLGLADALALAEAVGQHPDDPDAACAAYEAWRRPAVAPYEAIGGMGVRGAGAADPSVRPLEERWPPGD